MWTHQQKCEQGKKRKKRLSLKNMKKKVYSESEMGKAVKKIESDISVELIARNLGVHKATLYTWKSKYSGMEVSQIKRLKELEEENRKLKQMYADLALDNRNLKDVIKKSSRARNKERAKTGYYR